MGKSHEKGWTEEAILEGADVGGWEDADVEGVAKGVVGNVVTDPGEGGTNPGEGIAAGANVADVAVPLTRADCILAASFRSMAASSISRNIFRQSRLSLTRAGRDRLFRNARLSGDACDQFCSSARSWMDISPRNCRMISLAILGTALMLGSLVWGNLFFWIKRVGSGWLGVDWLGLARFGLVRSVGRGVI